MSNGLDPDNPNTFKHQGLPHQGKTDLSAVVPATSRKPSADELDARLDIVCELLAEGRRTSFIHRFARSNWHLAQNTIDKYIRLARDRLLEATGRPREDLRAEMWAYLNRIRLDKNSSLKERIDVSAMMIDLYGLNMPKQIHVHATKQGEFEYLDRVIDILSIEELNVIDKVATLAEDEREKNTERLRLEAEQRIIDVQADSVSVGDEVQSPREDVSDLTE